MVESPGDGFETAFTALLAGDEGALGPWLDAGEPAGLDVYRNTVAKARVDALAGLYPTVERLVGPDWFKQAGLVFAARSPPVSPVLDEFGADFPAWLETFPPALELPYLPPVAQLDRAWSRAHRAPEAPTLPARIAADTPSHTLFASRVVMHPSVALFWFDWTVPTIWLSNRPDAQGETAVWEDRAEGLLIARPGQTVISRRLSRPEWLFLDACRAGKSLGEAARDAFAADPALDLGPMFAGLLAAGALSQLQTDPAAHD